MPHRILVVDDDLVLLQALATFLALFKDDYEVRTAPTGEHALGLFDQFRPDVLLADLSLPGMDGVELIRQAVRRRPGIRVIVMTGQSSSENRSRSLNAGAMRYLEKPVNLSVLRDELEDVLRQGSGWSGQLAELDLFDLVQLMVVSRKPKAIRVSSDIYTGTLVFRDGGLFHASTPGMAGTPAFMLMSTWQGASFEDMPLHQIGKLERNISGSATKLLIEAARLRDESLRSDSGLSGGSGPGEDPSIEGAGAGEALSREQRDRLESVLAQMQGVPGLVYVCLFGASGENLVSIGSTPSDQRSIVDLLESLREQAERLVGQFPTGGAGSTEVQVTAAGAVTALIRSTRIEGRPVTVLLVATSPAFLDTVNRQLDAVLGSLSPPGGE